MGDTADRPAYTTAHLDDIPFEAGESPGTEWKPIRRFFGIGSFGTNVARATEAGDILTHDHDEAEARHEELFLIVARLRLVVIVADVARLGGAGDVGAERADAEHRIGFHSVPGDSPASNGMSSRCAVV